MPTRRQNIIAWVQTIALIALLIFGFLFASGVLTPFLYPILH